MEAPRHEMGVYGEGGGEVQGIDSPEGSMLIRWLSFFLSFLLSTIWSVHLVIRVFVFYFFSC